MSDARAAFDATLATLGFGPTLDVAGRWSVAEHFPAGRSRSGLYCLCFADGQAYVGKTSDVARRFVAHRRRWRDIVGVAFRPVPVGQQAAAERDAIHAVNPMGLLRNVEHVDDPLGETDFDQLFADDPGLPSRWLYRPHACAAAERSLRTDDTSMGMLAGGRRRYQDRFDLLRQMPEYPLLREILCTYIQGCLPGFVRTERSFWSVSCLPATKGWRRFMVVNVNRMEALVMGWQSAEPERNWAFVNVASSVLLDGFGGLRALRLALSDVEIDDAQGYAAGGRDQVRLEIASSHATPLLAMRDLLAQPVARRAACTLATRLMRKGGTLYASSHCPQLVDAALRRSRRHPPDPASASSS